MVGITRYSRSDQDLPHIDPIFGALGPVTRVSLHHTAGPLATTKAKAIALHREYDRAHRAKGWGGIGYHLGVDSLGRLYDLRPKKLKGAHVGGQNSGNFGICVHGNYMVQKLNPLQRRTLKALYRGNVKGLEFLGDWPWKGHQEYPGPTNAGNACPGADQMRFLRWLRNRPR